MYTILALIMWNGSLVEEDFGSFDTIEHCDKVANEFRVKLKEAGSDSVTVCIPATSEVVISPSILPEEVRG